MYNLNRAHAAAWIEYGKQTWLTTNPSWRTFSASYNQRILPAAQAFRSAPAAAGRSEPGAFRFEQYPSLPAAPPGRAQNSLSGPGRRLGPT